MAMDLVMVFLTLRLSASSPSVHPSLLQLRFLLHTHTESRTFVFPAVPHTHTHTHWAKKVCLVMAQKEMVIERCVVESGKGGRGLGESPAANRSKRPSCWPRASRNAANE